ncbi:MAG: hypothetical protein ACI8X3_002406 [Saprospiraceae bacterium]|jgi:hypothetical protein
MSKIVNPFKYLFALFLSLLLIISCKDRIDGCRDIEATNYDVSADDPCSDDCCTYPSLLLEVSHKYDSLNFSFASTYIIAGDTLRFEQVIFYLSNFRLVNETDSMEVVDTIELDIIGQGTDIFKDDYTLVSRSVSSFSYNVGQIRGTGEFNTLKFSVGIAGNAAFANAGTVTDGHPLSINTDTLWTDTAGYVFNRVTVIPDTSNISIVRQIDINGGENLVEVSLAFSQEVILGIDVEIPLKIDYEKWFSGIDFVNDSTDVIITNIVEQTTNAFSINE